MKPVKLKINSSDRYFPKLPVENSRNIIFCDFLEIGKNTLLFKFTSHEGSGNRGVHHNVSGAGSVALKYGSNKYSSGGGGGYY